MRAAHHGYANSRLKNRPETVQNLPTASQMPHRLHSRRTAPPTAAPSHPRHRWPAADRLRSMPRPRLHWYGPATWPAAAPHSKPQPGNFQCQLFALPTSHHARAKSHSEGQPETVQNLLFRLQMPHRLQRRRTTPPIDAPSHPRSRWPAGAPLHSLPPPKPRSCGPATCPTAAHSAPPTAGWFHPSCR